jgi:hypothetical protein
MPHFFASLMSKSAERNVSLAWSTPRADGLKRQALLTSEACKLQLRTFFSDTLKELGQNLQLAIRARKNIVKIDIFTRVGKLQVFSKEKCRFDIFVSCFSSNNTEK